MTKLEQKIDYLTRTADALEFGNVELKFTKIDDIAIGALLAVGFTLTEIAGLEMLANNEIRAMLLPEIQFDRIQMDNKLHVIAYLRAWVRLLQKEIEIPKEELVAV